MKDFSASIPSDRLEAAQQALFESDRTKADQLLAEIQESTLGTIQLAAEAALLRGEIADQEFRWSDAARHFGDAARLDPSYAQPFEARVFAGRDGAGRDGAVGWNPTLRMAA